MNAIACPNRHVLSSWLEGVLPEEESDEIGSHVDDCRCCQAIAEELEAGSGVFALLIGLDTAATLPLEPGVRALIDRACSSGPPQRPQQLRSNNDSASLPKLHDYELLERLGQGGMGTVYKARHTKLNRLVAVKVIRADLLAEDGAVARFEREMTAVGCLQHPNIVQATDAREQEGLHFLVMEYVEGVNVAVLLQEGSLTVAGACDIARQTALALQHAHEHGLVHRDVKPSNLMRTPDGMVKLLDLGLARLYDPAGGHEQLTAIGQVMGTLDYIAPEQIDDATHVDVRADIYSLGCTLFHMLTGQVPFPQGGNAKKLTAHLYQPPPSVSRLRGDVPQEVIAMVAQMMAKKPEDRPALPIEIAERLRPYSLEDNRQSLRPNSPQLDASSPSHSSVLTHTRPARGQFPKLVALAGFACVLLAGMVFSVKIRNGTLVLRWSDSPAGNAQVRVEQDKVRIEDSAVSDVPLTISTEKRQLVMQEGGQTKRDEKTLTVQHPGKASLTAEFIREEAPSLDPKAGPIMELSGHGTGIGAVAFGPDGAWAVSAAASFEPVLLWDLPKHRQTGRREPGIAVTALLCLPDRNQFVCIGNGLTSGAGAVVRIYDRNLEKPNANSFNVPLPVSQAAVSKDGRLLAMIEQSHPTDRVSIWDLKTGGKKHELPLGTKLCSVAFTPRADFLLIGGEDKTLRVWNLVEGGIDRVLDAHPTAVAYIAAMPDGVRAWSFAWSHYVRDSHLYQWDLRSGEQLAVIDLGEGNHELQCVAISPDGTRALTGSTTGVVAVWDLTAGTKQGAYQKHEVSVWRVAFSPDGHWALSGDQNGRLWHYRL